MLPNFRSSLYSASATARIADTIAGGGTDDGDDNGKINQSSQGKVAASLDSINNGKRKQVLNASSSINNGALTRKGKGNRMISGASSSLLGDIIAELDDLLDADFFSVATNSSDNFNEKGWHLVR